MPDSQLAGAYLQGKRFYIFGKLAGMARRNAESTLRDLGGKIASEIDGAVDIIIVGEANPLGTDWLDLTEQFHKAARRSFEQGRLEIMTESQLWELLKLDEVSHASHPYYTPAMLSELTQVSAAKIRLWLRRGFLRASKIVGKLPYFDFQEILAVQQLKRIFLSGISPENLAKKLSLLKAAFTEIDRPLFHLIFAEDQKTLLLRFQGQLYDSCGQRFFDFHPFDDSERMKARNEDFSYEENAKDSLEKDAVREEEKKNEMMVVPSEGLLPFSPFSFPPGLSSIDAALTSSSVSDVEGTGDFLDDISERDRYYIETEIGKKIVSLCETAQDEESQGNFREAVNAYRMALALGGESADISFQLAELFAETGHFEAARERYYVVLELEENHLEARVGLGRVLTALKEEEEAVSIFQGTLAIHPDFLEVRFLLGKLLFLQGRLAEAEEHLLYFKEADPASPQAQEVDAMLVQIRRSSL